MTLKSDRRDNVYVEPARPVLTCLASGFADETSQVLFELLDRKGQTIISHKEQLVVSAGGGTRRAPSLALAVRG